MIIVKWILVTTAIVSIVIGCVTIKHGYDAFILKENESKLSLEQISQNHTLHNMADLGQYYSGTTGMFFTLSTVLFIILAYLNQREEIKHLQEMNKAQNTMLKAQVNKDEFEKFERTFYRLLDWHSAFMNSISFTYNQIYLGQPQSYTYYGRGAINYVLIDFNSILNQCKKNNKSIEEAIDIAFLNMFRGNDDMKPYFNNLFSVLDFVDNYVLAEVIEEDESYKFMSLIVGQLSSSEVELLCYYGLYSKSPDNMKELIENNGLLINLDTENANKEAIALYDKRAFV